MSGSDCEVQGGRRKRWEVDGSDCEASGDEHVESNVEGRGEEEVKGWI